MAASTHISNDYTRSSLDTVDWSTFFDAVKEFLDLHLEATQWIPEDKPVFRESFPRVREGKFDEKFDVIAWSVQGSEMAQTDNAGARKPHGIQLRGSEPHPTKHGYKKEVWGWWECMVPRFSIYAKTNERANELAKWFHFNFMIYAHRNKFFQSRGVRYFKFLRRLPDRKTADFGQELYVRELEYEVHLNIQCAYEAKVLEDVVVSVASRQGGEVSAIEVINDGLSTSRTTQGSH